MKRTNEIAWRDKYVLDLVKACSIPQSISKVQAKLAEKRLYYSKAQIKNSLKFLVDRGDLVEKLIKRGLYKCLVYAKKEQ